MKTELIQKSKAYAEKILSNLPEVYTYHNMKHTESVAAAVEEIGRASNLTDDELETAIVAAWFHDTGYRKDVNNHEEVAVQNAVQLLQEWGAPKSKIDAVKGLIEATRMPQNPKNNLEKVLCDADMHHLGNGDIMNCSNDLRNEFESIKQMKFESDEEWIQFNLNFLKQHQYFTPYGQTILQERKKKNIKKFKKMLKPGMDKDYVKNLEKELEKLQKKLDKKANPDRGIETMFKIASENHTTLSGMADTKSNIMISINSIILSVVITVLFRKLEEFPNLLIPTLMLVFTCLVTIVFAILATRPNVSLGKFTRKDIEEKKTNLLFFGNFHGMEFPNYDWGMRQMMKDADFLYGSLIMDIYYNGQVLARKYKLLRYSYSFFMFGFVASIIGFTIALLMYYYPSNAF
ncbi:MAG TPA: Pycsar system effector family protein [Cyclobacteriaceae bacterium]|nr:Pycsar system effector family protein [Cyclobacteriaceae bacterium]